MKMKQKKKMKKMKKKKMMMMMTTIVLLLLSSPSLSNLHNARAVPQHELISTLGTMKHSSQCAFVRSNRKRTVAL